MHSKVLGKYERQVKNIFCRIFWSMTVLISFTQPSNPFSKGLWSNPLSGLQSNYGPIVNNCKQMPTLVFAYNYHTPTLWPLCDCSPSGHQAFANRFLTIFRPSGQRAICDCSPTDSSLTDCSPNTRPKLSVIGWWPIVDCLASSRRLSLLFIMSQVGRKKVARFWS